MNIARKNPKHLLRLTLVLTLAVLVACGFILSYSSSAQGGDDDADIPPKLRGLISKEEYHNLRDTHINRLRGMADNVSPAVRTNAIRQMEQQEQTPSPLLSNLFWTSIGPAPLPNGQTTTIQTPVSGRTISIAIHPINPNIVYVGTAQGGLYRTLNGGFNWQAIFDAGQSLAIGALALAPSDPEILYVGTGEPNSSCDSFFGVGLYRINNASTTANLTGPINPTPTNNVLVPAAQSFTGRAISKILVHPTDPATVFVSTFSGIGGIGCSALGPAPPVTGIRGIYRSTNATASPASAVAFTKLTVTTSGSIAPDTTGNLAVADMVMEPGVPNNIICWVNGTTTANNGGIYRTTNALTTATFTQTFVTTVSNARGELAINKVTSPSTVVTLIAATGETAAGTGCTTGSGALRRSVDGGATWSAKLAGGGGFCGGQCFYDIAVDIHPTDSMQILLGGAANGTCSRVYTRSTDGGATFAGAGVADVGLHADTHALARSESNPNIVWVGNDGGIWKSLDGGATWTSFNNAGFNATQFQSLALHPTDREFMIGGTQDNGTEFRRPDGTWTRADFGDGGFSLIDQSSVGTTNVTMYHTYFNQTNNFIGFARVENSNCATEGQWAFRGGFTFAPDLSINCDGVVTDVVNGINATDAVNFYAPIALGPGTPNTIYMGSSRLWRSANKGDLMLAVSQIFSAADPLSAIGISPQNDNVRIIGTNAGRLFATTTGANPMLDVDTGGVVPNAYIGRAVIDPTNSNTAYVTIGAYLTTTSTAIPAGQHVWKTTNLNAATPTWTAAGSGIPAVPVNAFAIDRLNPQNLYAGTDIGVYRSIDGGANWMPFSNGLPRVAVFDMAFQERHGSTDPERILRISTHGRGIWEIAVPSCTITIAPIQYVALSTGGSGSTLATAPGACTWFASSNVNWITVNADSLTGTGTKAVNFTVAPNTTVTRRVGTLNIGGQTFTVLQGASFTDVPTSHIFYEFINKISALGITNGCTASSFCPDANVTREQAAIFIERALGVFNPPQPAGQTFTDVPPTRYGYPFIEDFVARGITSGCGGGNYCPDDSASRGQIAVFIVRALGVTAPLPQSPATFDDVPNSGATDFLHEFIEEFVRRGITSGCDAGPPRRYCPFNNVTRGQMAVFMVRGFNL